MTDGSMATWTWGLWCLVVLGLFVAALVLLRRS
jgi:hypothetical protein